MIPLVPLAMALAQVAPGIAKLFTGSDKAEAIAEQVVGIAKAVTGIDDPEGAVKAVQADPNLQMHYKMAFDAKEADLEKAYLGDRQDARKRDTAFINAGRYNVRADLLAFLAVGGLVMSVWFIARDSDMPERAVNAIMFVAGVLASAVRDVYGFEFGSSRDSRNKTDIIAELKK